PLPGSAGAAGRRAGAAPGLRIACSSGDIPSATDQRVSKHLGKGALQRCVDLLHCRRDPEPGERGDAMLGNAAWHDTPIMLEPGVDIGGHAVIADPLPYTYPDRGDLFLAPPGPGDPDADTAAAALARRAEMRECSDDPFLELMDIAPHVLPAPPQI